jgi:hypothetical protein
MREKSGCAGGCASRVGTTPYDRNVARDQREPLNVQGFLASKAAFGDPPALAHALQ